MEGFHQPVAFHAEGQDLRAEGPLLPEFSFASTDALIEVPGPIF
jgi:hypothetical protein